MIKLNKPIKFLTIEWIEDSWEFDRPIVLLSPIIRYSDSDDTDNMIENAAIDICLDLENNEKTSNEDISKEFKWRGWNIDNLKRRAREFKNNKISKKKHYVVTERYFKFIKDGDEIRFEDCDEK